MRSRLPSDDEMLHTFRLSSWALGLGLFAAAVSGAGGRVGRQGEGSGRELAEPVEPRVVRSPGPQEAWLLVREPSPTVRTDFRRLFPHIPKELCVALLSTEAQKPPKTPILIRVGGGRTTPVTIVVPPGTQLQFKNTDPFKHRLYGVGIKTFQPNDTIKGRSGLDGSGGWFLRDPRRAGAQPALLGDRRAQGRGHRLPVPQG